MLPVQLEPACGRFIDALPFCLAACEFLFGHVCIQSTCFDVDVNHITVANQSQRAAFICFGAYVADGKAAGGAAEAAVGNQCQRFAQTLAQDGSHEGLHMGHSGASLGTLVADDDHVACHDLVAENGVPCFILAVIAFGGAAEDPSGGIDGAEFDNGAVGADVAVKDGQTAFRLTGFETG